MANVWLERISGHPSRSNSPPPQNRSFSPAPRRPSHLGPGAVVRPDFSPRSSSLNVKNFDSFTTSLNSPRLPNGSSLKQQVTPPAEATNPLGVLEEVVGRKLGKADGESCGTEKPPELIQNVGFGELSLQNFLAEDGEDLDRESSVIQSAEECEYVCSE